MRSLRPVAKFRCQSLFVVTQGLYFAGFIGVSVLVAGSWVVLVDVMLCRYARRHSCESHTVRSLLALHDLDCVRPVVLNRRWARSDGEHKVQFRLEFVAKQWERFAQIGQCLLILPGPQTRSGLHVRSQRRRRQPLLPEKLLQHSRRRPFVPCARVAAEHKTSQGQICRLISSPSSSLFGCKVMAATHHCSRGRIFVIKDTR